MRTLHPVPPSSLFCRAHIMLTHGSNLVRTPTPDRPLTLHPLGLGPDDHHPPPLVPRYLLFGPFGLVTPCGPVRRAGDVSAGPCCAGSFERTADMGYGRREEERRSGIYPWVRFPYTLVSTRGGERPRLTGSSDYDLALKFFLRAVEMETDPSDLTLAKANTRTWWGVKLVSSPPCSMLLDAGD